MPIADSDVTWVQPPMIGLAEKLYLPAIMQGFQTTLKHMFGPKVTQQFPEERPSCRPTTVASIGSTETKRAG